METLFALLAIGVGAAGLLWALSLYRAAKRRQRRRERSRKRRAHGRAWDLVMGTFRQPKRLTYRPDRAQEKKRGHYT